MHEGGKEGGNRLINRQVNSFWKEPEQNRTEKQRKTFGMCLCLSSFSSLGFVSLLIFVPLSVRHHRHLTIYMFLLTLFLYNSSFPPSPPPSPPTTLPFLKHTLPCCSFSSSSPTHKP